jgi:hypothetical protein
VATTKQQAEQQQQKKEEERWITIKIQKLPSVTTKEVVQETKTAHRVGVFCSSPIKNGTLKMKKV